MSHIKQDIKVKHIRRTLHTRYIRRERLTFSTSANRTNNKIWHGVCLLFNVSKHMYERCQYKSTFRSSRLFNYFGFPVYKILILRKLLKLRFPILLTSHSFNMIFEYLTSVFARIFLHLNILYILSETFYKIQ